MKILAFGDTQIGVSTVSLIDQARVLDRIVERAVDERVDIVIHGGDVFEGPVVTPEHLRCFLDGTAPLRAAGIPMCIALGNGKHDSSTRAVHALDVLREIDGITVSDRPEVHMINEIAVCTLPYVHPGTLLAKTDGTVERDAVNTSASALLVKIAEGLLHSVPPSRLSTVLLAHWFVSGTAVPTGLPADDMHEPVLPWAELDALGYHAVIAGHNHQPQRIDNPEIDRTLGIVVGSPQQLNFGEKGDHGCWIVDLAGTPSAEFVPIESKRFVTFDVDLDSYGAMEVSAGDIVRVRYRATEEEARQIDHEALRQSLLDAGASRVQIDPQIERVSRARATEITEQMTRRGALEAYLDANEIGGPLREQLVERFSEWSA